MGKSRILSRGSVQMTTGELGRLLQGLASEANDVREEYEKQYEDVWIAQPRILLPGLCAMMHAGETKLVRALAAVLYRRSINRSDKDNVRLWHRMHESEQAQCKSLLLDALAKEGMDDVKAKIAHAVAETARLAMVHEQWPELTLRVFTSDDDAGLSVLTAVPELAESQPPLQVAAFLHQKMMQESLETKVAAVRALTSVLIQVGDEQKRAFAGLFGALPALVAQMADKEEASDVLEELTALTAECPKLFKAGLGPLVQVLLAIGAAKDKEEETRLSALELLVSLAEALPGTFRKQPELLMHILSLLLRWVADVDDDLDHWLRASPEDENEQEHVSEVALQALDRLAFAIDGSSLLNPLFTLIPTMLGAAEWQLRYAALMALAYVAEGCAEALEDQLGGVLGLLWPCFHDPHPRVQHAACHMLGQLCSDFAGILQDHYSASALESLARLLAASSQPRVQTHAAMALVNFTEGVQSQTIAPFVDDIVNRLVGLLSTNVLYLQQQVLATIAALAGAAGPAFAHHYGVIAPICMDVLSQSLDREYRMLQCRALEALTLVISALEAAPKQDVAHLITVMLAINESKLADDDPMREYLASGWVRLCHVLKADFAPLLPMVLPGLLADARMQPDLALLDADEDAAEYDQDDWHFMTVRGKTVGIRTSTLEIKCGAVENVATFAQVLGGLFSAYIPDVFPLATELLAFELNEDVQCAAADLVQAVVRSALLAQIDETSELAHTAATALTACFAKSPELSAAAMDALSEIIKLQGGRLIADAAGIVQQLGPVVALVVKSLHKKMVAAQDDEEDDEQDVEDEERVCYAMARLVQTMLKTFSGIVPQLQVVLQFCFECVASQVFDGVRHACLCIVDDVVRYGDAGVDGYAAKVTSCLATGFKAKDNEIKQAAIYGIGVCAHRDAYCQFALEHLPKLLSLVESRNAKMPSQQLVTENAVAACMRIMQSGKVDVAQVVPRWIHGLPVTHDEDEVLPVLEFLLALLRDSAGLVLGSSNEYAGHVIKVLFATILARDSMIKKEPMYEEVRKAIAALQGVLSPTQMQHVLGGFTREQLDKIQSF